MNFNENGYLDPGIYEITIDALEEHFVTAFPHSSTRRSIIDGYKRHLEELQRLGLQCVQFLDGSFISSKADPSDIDMVGFMDADEVDSLSDADQKILERLFSGPATKASYSCDAYFVLTFPENHPDFPAARANRKYWMGEFGYDREDTPKGIAQLVVSPDFHVKSSDENA